MAQLNITLNQDEILLILQNNPGEGMRQILEKAINSILKVESANQLNAEPYERNEDRTDSRNGTRARNLNTRIGRLTLNVPRHRNVPFKTVIFENYSRSEAALVSTMAEMVVNGVSTRKVSKVIETLCGTSFSKSYLVGRLKKSSKLTALSLFFLFLTLREAFLIHIKR